jgi:hypothetical protein
LHIALQSVIGGGFNGILGRGFPPASHPHAGE